MSPFIFVDIEMYSDRGEDLQALCAELASKCDDGAKHEVPPRDDELSPIIQDEVPEWDTWGEAA